MRYTRKRGGDLTEIQREAQEVNQHIQLWKTAGTHAEKVERARALFQYLLQTRLVIKDPRFRSALQVQVNRAWDFDDSLHPLLHQVQAHLDANPIGGKRKRKMTRKRGGYDSDEHGRYAIRETELARVREALQQIEDAREPDEKLEAYRIYLQVILRSNVVVKNRGYRAVLRTKLADFRRALTLSELYPLVDRVEAYLDSIPESELEGEEPPPPLGGKRKTRTRKVHRK